jgi:hypothetical protein
VRPLSSSDELGYAKLATYAATRARLGRVACLIWLIKRSPAFDHRGRAQHGPVLTVDSS